MQLQLGGVVAHASQGEAALAVHGESARCPCSVQRVSFVCPNVVGAGEWLVDTPAAHPPVPAAEWTPSPTCIASRATRLGGSGLSARAVAD